VENIKVFEYAKQIGMETLTLMDKLRQFRIPVKSHMAELDPGTIAQIEAKFEEERQAAKPVKKAAARKKAAPKMENGDGADGKPAAARPSRAAAAKSSSAVKAGAAKSAGKSSAAGGAKKAAAVVRAGVVRRKATSEEDAAKEAAAAELQSQGARIISLPSHQSHELPQHEEEAGVSLEASHVDEAADHSPSPAAGGLQSATSMETVSSRASATTRVIGRLDLSQTMGTPRTSEEKQSAAESARAATNAHLEMHKMDKEHIAKLLKQEALAEEARKKATDRHGRGREEEVTHFNAADFRKRELLFQPKKKKILTGRAAQKPQLTTPKAHKRKVRIQDMITVGDLAKEMGVKANEVLKKLISMGQTATLNQKIDYDTAVLIASEFDYEVENVALTEAKLLGTAETLDAANLLKPRNPVVTIMGHVDHGKTSLLDAIRSAKVAAGEAGGITQHIGAYEVEKNGKKITFLDTPGHAAFTAMRARGAKVTDIVVLVVASDDGIMPQTREAISHAKAAGVPIIVCVNKMDLPQANPQRVLQQLTEFELVPEEWGGTTQVVKTAATKGEGVEELLEAILLQAEILDLKANPDRPGTGSVVEARMDRGRGPVATLLVQKGHVNQGDYIVAGTCCGRVRAMLNDRGQQIKKALPGQPIEVLGLDKVPAAGDPFDVAKDESTAADLVNTRLEKIRVDTTVPNAKMSLEELFAKVEQGSVKELNIVLKADVHGSAEALKEMLTKLSNEKVKVKVIHTAVGGISESDVLLASTANAIIIGFSVRPETGVNNIAKNEGIEIKTYSIIYEVVDDIKKAMTGLLDPTFVEKQLGRAEVRSIFNVPKVGTVAGCAVVDGKITRQSSVRLIRDSRVIYDGKLASLRRFKDDVREVATGYECGIGIENYNDIKVGDVIEAYIREQVTSVLPS